MHSFIYIVYTKDLHVSGKKYKNLLALKLAKKEAKVSEENKDEEETEFWQPEELSHDEMSDSGDVGDSDDNSCDESDISDNDIIDEDDSASGDSAEDIIVVKTNDEVDEDIPKATYFNDESDDGEDIKELIRKSGMERPAKKSKLNRTK